jgi:hypothetical protein
MNPHATHSRHRWPAAVALLAASGLALAGSAEPPGLADVLRRAGEVVVRHAEESAVLLADESCEQSAFTVVVQGMAIGQRGVERSERRRWKAELALVRLSDRRQPAVPWIEVRDIVEVDGKSLPDREARLERMLQQHPQWKAKTARDMVDENARFNIGPVRRSINMPSIPLLVLHPFNQQRFTFTKVGEKTVDRVVVWKVAFREDARPALIRAADDGSDMPSAGTFWIDPATGAVVHAELQCGRLSETQVTVTYRRHHRFDLHLPVEMVERARDGGGQWVEGKCRYTNFRRFETGGRMIVPKPPIDR